MQRAVIVDLRCTAPERPDRSGKNPGPEVRIGYKGVFQKLLDVVVDEPIDEGFLEDGEGDEDRQPESQARVFPKLFIPSLEYRAGLPPHVYVN